MLRVGRDGGGREAICSGINLQVIIYCWGEQEGSWIAAAAAASVNEANGGEPKLKVVKYLIAICPVFQFDLRDTLCNWSQYMRQGKELATGWWRCSKWIDNSCPGEWMGRWWGGGGGHPFILVLGTRRMDGLYSWDTSTIKTRGKLLFIEAKGLTSPIQTSCFPCNSQWMGERVSRGRKLESNKSTK